MTTTISLAARDFIVIGSDSLATTSMELVNPKEIHNAFFDPAGNLKLDAAGNPLLKSADQIWMHAASRPVNQLPSVTKLFSLDPKRCAALFAGVSRIGDVSVKNLVERFKELSGFKKLKDYTIEEIANSLRDFIVSIYDAEIPAPDQRPMMEILLSGYSNSHRQPEIFRILLQWDWNEQKFVSDVKCEVQRGNYDIQFGGQYDVIQRVVVGIDLKAWHNLQFRCGEILNTYKSKIEADLLAHGHQLAILPPDLADPVLGLFSKDFGGVSGIFANVSDLSEKAGIEFVEFLIMTMIKAQEFSSSIPTVGGDIHLGVLTKSSGFRWVAEPYSGRAGNLSHS